MKCAFQLVRCDDGTRSQAVCMERTEFAKQLRSVFPSSKEEFFVLVLCEFSSRKEDAPDWDFSQAPLMRLEYFVDLFSPVEQQVPQSI